MTAITSTLCSALETNSWQHQCLSDQFFIAANLDLRLLSALRGQILYISLTQGMEARQYERHLHNQEYCVLLLMDGLCLSSLDSGSSKKACLPVRGGASWHSPGFQVYNRRPAFSDKGNGRFYILERSNQLNWLDVITTQWI